MVNPVFNFYSSSMEQELLEDLSIEAIGLFGIEMYYMPRRRTSFDQIYYEDDQSVFDTAYLIDIYVNNTEGFQGQGTFLSRLGLEIRDEATFTIARRTFAVDVTRYESEIVRPRERDLIYFPQNNKCFEITFVNDKPIFYQIGDLQVFEFTVQLFEYSSEKFTTGIPAIDILQQTSSLDGFDYGILSVEGDYIMGMNGEIIAVTEYSQIGAETDPTQDNIDIDDEIITGDIIDWRETNPFSEREPW